MKKLLAICLTVLSLGFSTTTFAQSFGYVDTQSVLEQMNEYQDAQTQIDEVVDGWKKEIEQRYKRIDEMYREFQAEQVLLTDNERKKREDDIVKAEKETRDFQKQKFGTNGDLFKKRQEMVSPIQDRVYDAVKALAAKKKLDFIFDKSGGMSMLFANPKFDFTKEVVRELGISSNK